MQMRPRIGETTAVGNNKKFPGPGSKSSQNIINCFLFQSTTTTPHRFPETSPTSDYVQKRTSKTLLNLQM